MDGTVRDAYGEIMGQVSPDGRVWDQRGQTVGLIDSNGIVRDAVMRNVGEVKLMKLGRRLAVGEVGLYSAGDDDPAAHAVATYSIPPQE